MNNLIKNPASPRIISIPLAWLLSLLIFKTLVFPLFRSDISGQPEKSRIAVDPVQVQQIIEGITEENGKACMEFEKRLNAILASRGLALENACRRASANVSTYGNCTDLVCYVATDNVLGGNRAQDFIQRNAAPVLEPEVRQLTEEVNASLKWFNDELMTGSRHAAGRILTICSTATVTIGQVQTHHLQELQLGTTLNAFGQKAIVIGLELSLEAWSFWETTFIQGLWREAVKLAARLFSKQIAKASVSVSFAVLDGPLPFGDVLAGIGLVWTAWDVSEARENFENQLRADLLAEMNEKIETIRKEVVKAANQRMDDHARFLASLIPPKVFP